MRHRRIGLAWEMVRSKRQTRSWLPERCTDAFRLPSDHVLGPKAAGFRQGDGRSPAWNTRRSYAWSVMAKRRTLLRLRSRHARLRTSCTASSSRRSWLAANRCPRKRRRRRRRSLAGSWGKGKGLGKDGRVKKTATKNRSLKVCFAYNKNKGCPFAQICSRCGDQHPYHKCSEVKRPPGSAGNDE